MTSTLRAAGQGKHFHRRTQAPPQAAHALNFLRNHESRPVRHATLSRALEWRPETILAEMNEAITATPTHTRYLPSTLQRGCTWASK
jgi:hypothetical protein